MSCEQEDYPIASRDLHGGHVFTKDKTPLSTAQIEMTILSSTVKSPPPATTWHVPDFVLQENSYTVKAQLLVGPSTAFALAAGRYRCWYRVTDAPETTIVSDTNTFRIVE